MKKILFLILMAYSFVGLSQQKTDGALITQGNTISNAGPGQNTNVRIGGYYNDLVNSKLSVIPLSASGTNTYIAASSVVTSYSNCIFEVVFQNGNSGAATLNINSLGAVNLQKLVSGSYTALSSGDIQNNQRLEVWYDQPNNTFQVFLGGGSGGGTTSNALTVDNSSLQLNSGTTFDGSAAKTISVKASGITNSMLAGSIDLTTKVTGVLPIANGGTGGDGSVNTQTNDYILALSDAATVVDMNKATAINLTVPPNSSVAFPIGTIIYPRRIGAGQLTIVQGSGVTITSTLGSLVDAGTNVMMTLRKTGTDTWDLQNGVTVTFTAWTPTYTGFSSDPSGGARYVLMGKICFIYLQPTAGTSNATTTTFTLPFTAAFTSVFTPIVVNNGTQQAGRIQTSNGSNVCTAYATVAAGAWTASGTKNIQISGWFYEIQ